MLDFGSVPNNPIVGAHLKKFDSGVSPMGAGVMQYPDDVKGSDNAAYAVDAFTTWITPSNVAVQSATAAAAEAATDPNTGQPSGGSLLSHMLGLDAVQTFLKQSLILFVVLLFGLLLVAFGLRSLTK
jgi:hypothetical protein